MAIRIIRNVPADEVEGLTRLLKESGATSVNTDPESDGEFTLVVIYPNEEQHSAMKDRVANE